MQGRAGGPPGRRAPERVPGRANRSSPLQRGDHATHEGRAGRELEVSAAVAPLPETDESADSTDLPVVLLTPTGRDSSVAERVLTSAGIPVRVCKSMEDVCR